MKIDKNHALYADRKNINRTAIFTKRTYAAKFLSVSKKRLTCLIKPDPFNDRVFSSEEIQTLKNNFLIN